MSNIYNDHTYLENNPEWHAGDALFKAGHILKLLKQIPDPLWKIAEIGCGSGQILVELSSKLPEHILFFGFDVSNDAIGIAKEKETSRIKIEQLDLIEESEEYYFFDVLLVIDVLEHIDNYFKFLDGIKKKAKYTIFHIPLDLSVWSLFREKMLIESKERVGHIHNFTEDFVKDILEDHGFQVLLQTYTEPMYERKSFKEAVVNSIRKILFKINKRFATKSIGGFSILVLTQNKY
ncbi:MAG TPA: class I SAM-dependent methyltransferase [Puia sp.]|jgi:SAM-dependent methyltransferase